MCVSYLVREWSAYHKVWISGAGAAHCSSAAKLPTHKTFTLQTHLLSGPGTRLLPLTRIFATRVTGSRAERMQVRCNIVRTRHSANIILPSCRLPVPGVGGYCRTLQSHLTITTTLQNAAFSQYLMVHCTCILSALCGHVDNTTDSFITLYKCIKQNSQIVGCIRISFHFKNVELVSNTFIFHDLIPIDKSQVPGVCSGWVEAEWRISRLPNKMVISHFWEVTRGAEEEYQYQETPPPSPRCLTGDCASVCSRGGQLACVSSGECWPGALPWPAVPRSNECNVYLRDGIIFKKPD